MTNDNPLWSWRKVPFVAWFVAALGLTFLVAGIGVGIYTLNFVQRAE